jgi:hypothetical protein
MIANGNSILYSVNSVHCLKCTTPPPKMYVYQGLTVRTTLYSLQCDCKLHCTTKTCAKERAYLLVLLGRNIWIYYSRNFQFRNTFWKMCTDGWGCKSQGREGDPSSVRLVVEEKWGREEGRRCAYTLTLMFTKSYLYLF